LEQLSYLFHFYLYSFHFFSTLTIFVSIVYNCRMRSFKNKNIKNPLFLYFSGRY
jgi:hypothetical protein